MMAHLVHHHKLTYLTSLVLWNCQYTNSNSNNLKSHALATTKATPIVGLW